MLVRLFILLALLLIGAGVVGLWRLFLWRRVRQLATVPVPEELTQLVPTGPALLYFTTKSCVQCRFQQTPIVTQLAAATQIPVHTVDAVEHETLARFYGIMTVPTTIWLDKMRRPAAINHGLTGLALLCEQAQEVYAR